MSSDACPESVPPHPGASSEILSRQMSKRRNRDTQPELAIRRRLFALGMRYRVAYPIPGQARRTVDIAFPRRKLAVFVDGCFWHGCPIHGNKPRANATWWERKLEANQSRDRDSERLLTNLGWDTLRIWEHEEPGLAVRRIAARVTEARTQDLRP